MTEKMPSSMMVLCPQCEGEGEDPMQMHEGPCPECQGKGELFDLLCFVCEGDTSHPECPHCWGEGRIEVLPCPVCHGVGLLDIQPPCSSCRGYGGVSHPLFDRS
jgi:DnaJ-class molecular chaperone